MGGDATVARDSAADAGVAIGVDGDSCSDDVYVVFRVCGGVCGGDCVLNSRAAFEVETCQCFGGFFAGFGTAGLDYLSFDRLGFSDFNLGNYFGRALGLRRLGPILGLGRKRNLGADHLVYLRDLSAHASSDELARPQNSFAFGVCVCGSFVHVYRSKLFVAVARIFVRQRFVMILTAVGISHQTAPIELREKLTLNADQYIPLVSALKAFVVCSECVVVSTCNRTEIYLVSERAVSDDCVSFLKHYFKIENLQNFLYVKTLQEAVSHLFRVTSGLDSLVLGENEILKQVKDAYLSSHKAGWTGKILNVLFQRALYVGKMVRARTSINQGSLSVSSIAVSLAELIFGNLTESSVLLFGAGTMAELAAKQLLSKNVRQLWVANRTLENAQSLASQFNAQALTLQQGIEHLFLADIVITSLALVEPFIHKKLLEDLILRRKNRSLFMIDIAMPRNVESGIHTLDNVYLYNIDDLERLAQENRKSRQASIDQAEKMVALKSAEFYEWLLSLQVGSEKSLKHHFV